MMEHASLAEMSVTVPEHTKMLRQLAEAMSTVNRNVAEIGKNMLTSAKILEALAERVTRLEAESRKA